MASALSNKDLFRRVCGKTKADLGVSWHGTVTYCTTTIGAFLFSYWFTRGEQSMSVMDSFEPFLYGLCGMVLTLLVHFLWNLWLAPYRIMEEHLNSAIAKGQLPIAASEPQKINVAHYKEYHYPTLYEAACLWVEIEPHNPITSHSAKVMLGQLKGAISRGALNSPRKPGLLQFADNVSGAERILNGTERVHLIDLRRYADHIGNVPKFLQHVQIPSLPATEEGEEQSDKSP